MRVFCRFPCISGISSKQVASVIFRQFLNKELEINMFSTPMDLMEIL